MTTRRPIAPLAPLPRDRAPPALVGGLAGPRGHGLPAGRRPGRGSGAGRPRPTASRPSIQYEEAGRPRRRRTVVHAGRPGVASRSTPRAPTAGRCGGVDPQRDSPPGACPASELAPARSRDRRRRSAAPVPKRSAAPIVPADRVPILDPSARSSPAHLAAAVDPGGLRREVFGFLPYWELTDSVDPARLGEAVDDRLLRRRCGRRTATCSETNADGSTTVGWSGWTSSKLTTVINAAHASGARVVLTVQSFAWTSSGVTRQKALLGSPAGRANLARQIAAAVRDRGADGVNLDFEPIVSDVRRRVHRARPDHPDRAEPDRAGLPADVRHDRLDRQLPDRGGDRARAAPTPS